MSKDEKSVTPKMLKDVKKVFLNEPNRGTLITFFACLVESNLYVPIRDLSSNEDDPKADFLFDGKAIYLPIFSDMEDVIPEYRQKFSWLSLSIGECLKLLSNNKDAIGLVIDPFTDTLKIKDNFLKVLIDMVEFENKNKDNETK